MGETYGHGQLCIATWWYINFLRAHSWSSFIQCFGIYAISLCQRAPGFISLSYFIKTIFIHFSSAKSHVAGSESATIQLAGSFWSMDVKHLNDDPLLQWIGHTNSSLIWKFINLFWGIWIFSFLSFVLFHCVIAYLSSNNSVINICVSYILGSYLICWLFFTRNCTTVFIPPVMNICFINIKFMPCCSVSMLFWVQNNIFSMLNYIVIFLMTFSAMHIIQFKWQYE